MSSNEDINNDCDCFSEPLLFIAGPTASGKTSIAIEIANEFNCEIIGVDSMQVYKHMDIGSAKPSKEELAAVPHHLIDYVDPTEKYDASRFIYDCKKAVRNIRSNNKIPLLVGGTGLYFKTFEHGIFSQPEINPSVKEKLRQQEKTKGIADLYRELIAVDPLTAQRVHENDRYRILRALEIFRSTGRTWSSFIDEHQDIVQKNSVNRKLLKIGLDRNRDELYERINLRVTMMIELGLVDEVKNLLRMGYSASLSSMQSLGYRHMTSFLNGEWSWEKAIELLARDTRHYAKRQFTWFRKDKDIRWFFPDEKDKLFNTISNFLKKNPLKGD